MLLLKKNHFFVGQREKRLEEKQFSVQTKDLHFALSLTRVG